MDREIKNARIDSTFLGIEDHGCFAYVLGLKYGDSAHQGSGLFALNDKRGFGIKYLRKLMETVGVSEWEKLIGTPVRVDADFGKVYRIGHLLEDRWMDLSEGVEG